MDAKDQNGFSYCGQKIRNAIFIVLTKSQDKISECLENFIICGSCGIISIFRWERHWTQSQTMVASAICLWIIFHWVTFTWRLGLSQAYENAHIYIGTN